VATSVTAWANIQFGRSSPILGFPPKFDEQPGLFAMVHLRDNASKQDETRMARTFPGQLPCVHRHRSPIEPNNHQAMLAQY